MYPALQLYSEMYYEMEDYVVKIYPDTYKFHFTD